MLSHKDFSGYMGSLFLWMCPSFLRDSTRPNGFRTAYILGCYVPVLRSKFQHLLKAFSTFFHFWTNEFLDKVYWNDAHRLVIVLLWGFKNLFTERPYPNLNIHSGMILFINLFYIISSGFDFVHHKESIMILVFIKPNNILLFPLDIDLLLPGFFKYPMPFIKDVGVFNFRDRFTNFHYLFWVVINNGLNNVMQYRFRFYKIGHCAALHRFDVAPACFWKPFSRNHRVMRSLVKDVSLIKSSV